MNVLDSYVVSFGVVVFVIVSLFTMTPPAWTEIHASAPTKVAEVVTGTVLSKNVDSQELTMQEDRTRVVRTLNVMNSDILLTLNEGDKIRVSIPADEGAE